MPGVALRKPIPLEAAESCAAPMYFKASRYAPNGTLKVLKSKVKKSFSAYGAAPAE
jgi:hypothetical protein